METFYGHKATLGADIGVVAGPVSSSILPSFMRKNKANFCSDDLAALTLVGSLLDSSELEQLSRVERKGLRFSVT